MMWFIRHIPAVERYSNKSAFRILILSLLLFGQNYSQIPGAYADGIRKDTKAIQAALDSVALLNGGIVRFTSGKYLTGPLVLKGNNLTVQIDSGATILASTDIKDYYFSNADTSKPPTSVVNFISSSGCNNLKIQGKGTIDGQGASWWPLPDNPRPRMLQLERGSGLEVKEVTLTNSPMFHLCPNRYYDVNIHDIKIIAPSGSPNTDGIDPGICHKVRITNCYIDNGDDNIAVGASSSDPAWSAASTDIIIKHCTFMRGHGVSIGSYTNGGVDSMLVDSCTFNGTTNGVRIKSQRGRGGNVRNITYSNLTMTNVSYPIYLTAYYSGVPSQSVDTLWPVTSTTPNFHDIKVLNVTATTPSPVSNAAIVVGVPEKPFTNISFENVSLSTFKGIQLRNATLVCDTSLINVRSGFKVIREIRSTLIDTSTHYNTGGTAFSLMQNFPNPFKHSTKINYIVSEDSPVDLRVYDILGREVAVVVHENKSAGKYAYQFNGAGYASGVYFYRMTAGSSREVRKMVLIK